jgi:hypothetical protein
VVAEVTGAESRWTADPPGLVETRLDLRVDLTLRGPPAQDLRVVVPGGQVGSVGLRVEHAPDLVVDRTYLLLLAPFGPGLWRVVGGELGAVPIRPDPADRVRTDPPRPDAAPPDHPPPDPATGPADGTGPPLDSADPTGRSSSGGEDLAAAVASLGSCLAPR